MGLRREKHAIVIPLFGEAPKNLLKKIRSFGDEGLIVVVVDNREESTNANKNTGLAIHAFAKVVENRNSGLIAGGLNRGINYAIQLDADIITILDQDSELQGSQVRVLGDSLTISDSSILVGPKVIDARRKSSNIKEALSPYKLRPTRMLISSGTTFRSRDWPALGLLNEDMGIDYVDHHWCFRAGARGFRCFTNETVILKQTFGERHPNWLCHQLGMQLYSPERHYRAVRNLLWLVQQPSTPRILSIKEISKMVLKAPLWLLCEPQRARNIKAIKAALLHPLPVTSKKGK